MFEKEAETKLSEEDYKLAEETIRPIFRNAIKNDYSFAKYGVECYLTGYNKANEWHYVKDGLPKDNEYVLIYTDLNNCYVAKKVENHFMSKGWDFISMSTVIAWKEIVLPELPGGD